MERVEGLFDPEVADDAIKLVKTIGMINLFGNAGVSFTKKDLSLYAMNALGIISPEGVIDLLTQHKIIRYAEYKSQYVLFEGTDVNIESELLKASGIVPRSKDVVDKLLENFSLPVEFANAAYYRKGTPRYFEYVISDYPINKQPQNEIDGYINLVFNESLTLEKLKQETSTVEEAILYAYFKRTDKVIDHIWMLDKLAYVQNIVDSADKVAHRELKALMNHERGLLNASVLDALFGYSQDVVWVYRGNEFHIDSKTSFNKFTCKKLLMTKKKLPVRFTGQHFTIDKVLIKDAIRQANISNQDTVLDIGAGKGFLTVHLLKIANNVVAIENDTALVEHLRKLFSDARNVQVVGCDFRNFAVPKFPFKVVSNIPYGITSDIFKILMFESLGNFLGGSIVLQLEPTQKLFSRKLYNPYTVFYHTFFDLKLVYEVGPESFLPPPTVKSALLNIKRKHLFFDFKIKAKYLAFISCLLEKPDLSVKTALKSIFRKSQVRTISEKFGLNLNAQIVCLSPSQWLNCFLEMLEVVPEKFHPS